jgi:hypothetical protein
MWNHDVVDGYDGFEPTWDLQEHVNADLFMIADYGERHADHYGGCWLQHWHLYGVSFTDAISDHQAELEALVGLPDRLRIKRCSRSLRQLRDTVKAIEHAEMQHAPDGSLVVTGVVGLAARVQRNVVVVRVLPGHQEVEDRLRAMYGPLISVVPGALAQAF